MMTSDTRKVQSNFSSLADATDNTLVLRQCALEQDLLLFDAGDKTEVGEKGLTLRYATQIYR